MGFSIYKFITGATDRAIRMRGFRREFVEANGAWQHYYVGLGKGSLPPVVVVHGLSGEATDLAPMFGDLRRHFSKVMVPDLPGHGRSEPPRDGMKSQPTFETFAAGLDQMIKEPCILLGNSLGGLATIRYANRSPQNVLGTVLYSPGGAPMSLRELIVFKNKFRNSNREETRRFLDMLVTRPPWYRRIVENVLRNRFLQPPVQELLRNVTPDILLQPQEVKALQPRPSSSGARQTPCKAAKWSSSGSTCRRMWRSWSPTTSPIAPSSTNPGTAPAMPLNLRRR